MLFSYNWLKKFTPIKATPKEVADKITLNLVEVNSLTKRGEDTIFEIENKGITNRPDCFSILGMAREVAAYFNLPCKDPLEKLGKEKILPEKELPLKVKVERPKLCPRYCAIVLTDIKVSPSPKWLKVGLENCGIRSINNVVDITNYIMLELGQPLHAFDYQKIEGKKIVVRKAKENEEITTLDGIKRKLKKDVLVIADKKKPIGIAGIMGGANTEVRKGTKTIVLESANFNPTNNRLTSKFLKLRTEASIRFEKGQDVNLSLSALIAAIKLFKKLTGARIASKIFDISSEVVKPWQIKVNSNWINKFLGTNLSPKEIKSILERLKLRTEIKDNLLLVTIPTFRPDLRLEADIAEEVARIYGYDNIPVSLPKGEMKPAKLNKKIFWEKKVKEILVSLGLTEVYTYPLVSRELIERVGLNVKNHLKLLNPLATEREYFRTTLTPSLIEVIAKNQNFFEDVEIFEIGRVFLKRDGCEPKEKTVLAAVLTGEKFYQAKGIVETLLKELNLPDPSFQNSNLLFKNVNLGDAIAPQKFTFPFLHSGRAAIVTIECSPSKNSNSLSKNNCLKKIYLGVVAEIHPSILEKFGVQTRVTVFELDFEEIFKHATTVRTYTPIPKYPPIVEDLAFVVPEKTLVGEMMKEIRKVSKLINQIELLDSYRNTRTFHLTYQNPKRTLTDREVKKIRGRIIKQISKKFGAKIKEE